MDNNTMAEMKRAPMVDQLRSLRWLLPGLYVPVIVLLVWITTLGSERAGHLLRDPHSLANMPFYVGMISNIGVVCWTITAAICLFSGVLKRDAPDGSAMSAFLLYAGIMTTLLMLDDFFLLHEDLFRFYLPVPEWLIYAAYAVLTLGLFARYRAIILSTDYLLLGLALLLLGLSVSIDLMQPLMGAERYQRIGGYVFEDGLKFAGILTWMVYFVRVCYSTCRANAENR